MLSGEVVEFFNRQGCVVVSTLSKDGSIHNACKGIVKIDEKEDRVFLFDLYHQKTYHNLLRNPVVSITAFDEYHFRGYSLQGKAQIVRLEKDSSYLLEEWERQLTSRITKRLLKNIKEGNKAIKHHEISLPQPRYLIVVKVEKIIDLRPRHIKEEV